MRGPVLETFLRSPNKYMRGENESILNRYFEKVMSYAQLRICACGWKDYPFSLGHAGRKPKGAMYLFFRTHFVLQARKYRYADMVTRDLVRQSRRPPNVRRNRSL